MPPGWDQTPRTPAASPTDGFAWPPGNNVVISANSQHHGVLERNRFPPDLLTTEFDRENSLSASVDTYRDPRFGAGHTHRRVSWPALFAGVFLVLAIEILLDMLGIGIGLGLVTPSESGTADISSYGTGAGIWWLVSALIALFIGGYASAWLAGVERRFDGMLHGLVVWAIATLLTIYLLTTVVGGLIGGAFSVVGHTIATASSGIAAAVPKVAQTAGVSPDMIQDQAKAYLQPPNPDPATMSPQDAQKAVATTLPTYIAGGKDAPAARDRIIAIMAAQMKISPEEATKRFDDTQAKLKKARDEAVQTAKQAADVSARAASDGAYMAFAVLLLGAIFAGIGGAVPRPRLAATSM